MIFQSVIGASMLFTHAVFHHTFQSQNINLIAPVYAAETTPSTLSTPSGSSFGPTSSYNKGQILEYYDYPSSKPIGDDIKKGDSVVLNVRAYLAGRQGWIYIDTFKSTTGEAIRLNVGETPTIKGLEIALLGDISSSDLTLNNRKTIDTIPMQAMKKGSKRRVLIPSSLGYQSKDQQPLPIDDGAKRRLYSTVLNSVRGAREQAALGDSIVGKVILDIQVIKILK